MRNALKLFVLRYGGGAIVEGDDGKPLYFSDKMAAKAAKPKPDCTVHPGPDHRKFDKGDK